MLRPGLILKGSFALETLDDRRVSERDDLSFGRTKFWDWLKGDRNAYEEICADDVSDTFSGRMRDFLRGVRSNNARTRAGAFFRWADQPASLSILKVMDALRGTRLSDQCGLSSRNE
jgi:hypothetical protein